MPSLDIILLVFLIIVCIVGMSAFLYYAYKK
ncbi:Uncharacterised protein [Helicobacter canadensis]|nr:Uncharacterised protein [Helicobacter canadensis]